MMVWFSQLMRKTRLDRDGIQLNIVFMYLNSKKYANFAQHFSV
jgi:hypothetical protein